MTPWSRGAEVDLHQVPLDQFRPGSSLVITEANYFGAKVKAAGTVQRVEMVKDGSYLYLTLTGTDSEELLRAHGGRREQVFQAHLCPAGCGQQESGDHFLHALKGRQGQAQEEGWVTCLETGAGDQGEDELELLRKRDRELGRQRREEEGAAKEPKRKRSRSPSVISEGKDKKKKKKKERRKKEDYADGRHAAKAVQKELGHLFGGTALDPKERVRRRVMRRAQRFAARKRGKRSTSSSSKGSSSSSTSSRDEVVGSDGVFSEETKARALAEKFPGALAMETLLSMRRQLLTTSGEDGEEHTTRPVALLYYRSVLSRRVSGPQARELLNLATAIDALLKGRPALTLDIMCQRLKAQEAVANGTAWAVAQKVELASSEAAALIARGELQTAQRESYLDARARWQAQSTSPAKGNQKGKEKGKSDKDSSMKEDKREDAKKEKGKGGGRK